MTQFSRVSFWYGDGTVFHRYYSHNRDGSNLREVPRWTTSTITKLMFGVPRTEETKADYDFDDDHGNIFVGHILLYTRGNPGCADLDWDVMSQTWNEHTSMGKEKGVLKLRFNMLKELYALWRMFERYYPCHRLHSDDDEWWTTRIPPEFQKFKERPMSSQTIQLLAQVPANFMD